MPPGVASEPYPEDVLRGYPLGVVTTLAAHSHHGHPDHKVTFPNGLEGWIYEIHPDRDASTYIEVDETDPDVREIKEGLSRAATRRSSACTAR